MRERRICAEHRYLLVPVGRQKYNFVSTEGIQILQIFQGETLKEEYELTLDEAPRSWSPIFLERYPRGTELTLRLTGGTRRCWIRCGCRTAMWTSRPSTGSPCGPSAIFPPLTAL